MSNNKNWLAFQRWIDVSGDTNGVTWIGIEPGVVEFGDLTANIIGGGGAWSKQLGDPRTIISWALNNHWHTNFPLEQGGVIPFHYALLPHGAYDPVTANRFGLEQSRPLVAVPAQGNPVGSPLVTWDNPRIFVSALKPADDGDSAVILRLRSLSDQPESIELRWPAGSPAAVHYCGVDERPEDVAGPIIQLLPFGIRTLHIGLQSPAVP